MRACLLLLVSAVSASSEIAEDLTLVLASAFVSAASERLASSSSSECQQALVLVEQIVSVGLAVSAADPTDAPNIVKTAALKAAAGQLMVLQSSLPAVIEDAVDNFAMLGIAIVASPENAAQLIRTAALDYAKETTSQTLLGDTSLFETSDEGLSPTSVLLSLTPTAVSLAKARLPAAYHAQLDHLSSLALAVAADPASAQSLLAAALKTAAAEWADRKIGHNAGKAVTDIAGDLGKELARRPLSREGIVLSPPTLKLTTWGKISRSLLRCVPTVRGVSRGRVGRAARRRGGAQTEALVEIVGDIVEDLSGKTLLQFMYFDMRVEMLEASRALVEINTRVKDRKLYEEYGSEQLAADLNYYVVNNVNLVLEEYELRKAAGGTSNVAAILDNTVPMSQLRRLASQLDVFVNEDDDGDLINEWPAMFALAKRVVDSVAVGLDAVMQVDAEGDCLFGCCGFFKEEEENLPTVELAVTPGLSKAVAKSADRREEDKLRLYAEKLKSNTSPGHV